ncbi:MAG: hypothetical protein J5J06_13910 [Phycisphaerae bacterium]|nr:hypothetical protein [Phycisphaerae bacterium]
MLKLTCTAEDMVPLAVAAAFDKGIHKWNPTERAELMAELDAAYFHLYGLSRDEVEYVMSTFAGASKAEQFDFGDATTADLVLEAYDVLSN